MELKLLTNLLQHPGLEREKPIAEQLPKLFTLAPWGGDVISCRSLKGRISRRMQTKPAQEAAEKKVLAAFREAFGKIQNLPADPVLIRLMNELESQPNPSSPLEKLPNPQLEKLESQYAENVFETQNQIIKYSLLDKWPGIGKTVNSETFKELFGIKNATLAARSYWTRFLKLFPDFKHPFFPEHQRLMAAARKESAAIDQAFKGKTVDQRDIILEEKAAAIAEKATSLLPGESMMLHGSFGPKVDTFKTLFRLIQSQPDMYTDWIPDILKSRELLEKPAAFIKEQLHTLLRDNAEKITPEQKQFIQMFAENTDRKYVLLKNGILGNIERITSISPSTEVLDLLRLFTQLPGIDSYVITGMFFYVFGLMRFLPNDQMLEAIQWINKNATRFSKPETREQALEDFEKLIDSLTDKPIQDFISIVSEQFELTLRTLHRSILSPAISEAVYESYPIDHPLLHAPYWFKLEKDSFGTYTAYIYSSGHALNFHTHKDKMIQWPMRISRIKPNQLTPAFFKRILMHRFKADYDLDFSSRADDLFSDEGIFATLRSPAPSTEPLEWRPYRQTFDTEWELLQASTTTGNREHASLYLHINAIIDFLRPFRNHEGHIDLMDQDEVRKLLENGVKTLINEYSHCKNEMGETEQKQIEWTIYELREALLTSAKPDETGRNELIPPRLATVIKSAMAASGMTSETILGYRHTISWLLGEEAFNAIELILKSADAAAPTLTIAAAPSKGWLRDALGNIYIKTAIHLLNIILSLGHWSSPFTLPWIYEAIIGILPAPIGEFIDYYCKKIMRLFIEKLFFIVLNALIQKNVIDQKAAQSIFTGKELLNSFAGSLTGNRRVSFDLGKTETISRLMVFSRFNPIEDIRHRKTDSQFTEISFSKHSLTFNIHRINGKLRAMNKRLFGNFAIAENQEDPAFIRYGSYLLLENSEKKKKVILPVGAELQTLGWRLFKKLGPLTGILGNLMGQQYPLPLRNDKHKFFSYDVDAKGRLTSNDPDALTHLAVIEVLLGNSERASHATDQLLHAIDHSPALQQAGLLERSLWPLALAPAVMGNHLTIDEVGNLFRIRQKILAALQKRMPAHSKQDPKASFLIALALYQDLQRMTMDQNPFDRETYTQDERDEQEWLLYQSLIRHFPGFLKTCREYNPNYEPLLSWSNALLEKVEPVADILSFTPEMGARYRILAAKYGATDLKKNMLSFLRDMAHSDWTIPAPSVMRPNKPLGTLHGVAEMADNEVPQMRLANQLYRISRTSWSCLGDPKVDWTLLSQSMNTNINEQLSLDVNAITKASIVSDFITYYSIALGEQGTKKRIELKKALHVHRGGWDQTTRVLIELLLTVSTPPIELPCGLLHGKYVEKLFPPSGELFGPPRQVSVLFQTMTLNALNVQTAYSAAKPLQDLAAWLAQGPLLTLAGGRTPLYHWTLIPCFYLGTKLANIIYREEKTLRKPATPKPPQINYSQLKLEEDKVAEEVLENIHNAAFNAEGDIRNGQTPLTLYRALRSHRNGLRKAFERDKEMLLNLANPKRVWESYRKPVNYKELLRCFFKGDFQAIASETALARGDLEIAMMRLVARETRLAHMDRILLMLENLVRDHAPASQAYRRQLRKIAKRLAVRRQYNGDLNMRRYLCYELGSGRLLSALMFPKVQPKLQDPKFFNSILSTTLMKY